MPIIISVHFLSSRPLLTRHQYHHLTYIIDPRSVYKKKHSRFHHTPRYTGLFPPSTGQHSPNHARLVTNTTVPRTTCRLIISELTLVSHKTPGDAISVRTRSAEVLYTLAPIRDVKSFERILKIWTRNGKSFAVFITAPETRIFRLKISPFCRIQPTSR